MLPVMKKLKTKNRGAPFLCFMFLLLFEQIND